MMYRIEYNLTPSWAGQVGGHSYTVHPARIISYTPDGWGDTEHGFILMGERRDRRTRLIYPRLVEVYRGEEVTPGRGIPPEEVREVYPVGEDIPSHQLDTERLVEMLRVSPRR